MIRNTQAGEASLLLDRDAPVRCGVVKPHIRAADESDLERINEIYNAVMVDSYVSFDVEPWDLDKRSSWWERYASGRYDAYVAEAGGTVVGVAYSGPYRDKVAYDSSVETTIVLDAAVTGRGIGSALLSALLDAVAASGAHRAYAIVALPNEASIALHERFGYRTIGVLDEVGHKMGEYWSTMILEKRFDTEGDRVG